MIPNVCFRPVNSNCESLSAIVSKYIDYYLQKLIKYVPSRVKNSTHVYTLLLISNQLFKVNCRPLHDNWLVAILFSRCSVRIPNPLPCKFPMEFRDKQNETKLGIFEDTASHNYTRLVFWLLKSLHLDRRWVNKYIINSCAISHVCSLKSFEFPYFEHIILLAVLIRV